MAKGGVSLNFGSYGLKATRPESNGGCKLVDVDNDGIPNIDDSCPNEAGEKRLNGCPKMPISLSIFLNSYSDYSFDFDSYELSQVQISNISDLSKILIKYDYIKLNIDGHASSEGESEYNMQLSQNRSNSVKNTLINNGVKDSRLKTRAYGESMPSYPDFPLSERKKNRRVKISVEN